MSFITIVANSVDQLRYNPEWVQYIKDHKRFLLDSSIKYEITPEDMSFYNYKFNMYLESIGFDLKHAWIVLLINELKNDSEFFNLKHIYCPSTKLIDTYIRNFIVSNKLFNKN